VAALLSPQVALLPQVAVLLLPQVAALLSPQVAWLPQVAVLLLPQVAVEPQVAASCASCPSDQL
jgi:hypothetical protein